MLPVQDMEHSAATFATYEGRRVLGSGSLHGEIEHDRLPGRMPRMSWKVDGTGASGAQAIWAVHAASEV